MSVIKYNHLCYYILTLLRRYNQLLCTIIFFVITLLPYDPRWCNHCYYLVTLWSAAVLFFLYYVVTLLFVITLLCYYSGIIIFFVITLLHYGPWQCYLSLLRWYTTTVLAKILLYLLLCCYTIAGGAIIFFVILQTLFLLP